MGLAPALRERLARLADSSEKPPALVFECSYVNGLSAIRSLARVGAPVVALDHRRAALGMRSRLALGVVGPPPGERERFAEHLSQVCDALGREAVAFPTHDDYLVAVNDAAPAGLRLPFGPRELIDRVQAKRFQYEAAERAGVRLPQTFHPASVEQAEEAAAGIPYPAVMKPSLGSGFKARYGKPLIEAADAGRAGGRLPAGRAVPADVPGADTGRRRLPVDGGQLSGRRGAGAGRVLRQEAAAGAGRGRNLPRGRGGVGLGRGCGALRLLRELGFHGISQVEYKRDPRDGSLRLMEVNARLWQWHSLASDCGVDLVEIAYRDALGLPVREATSERAGHRRWVALVRHLRESRRDRLGLRETLAPLRPPFSEPVLSLRDPMPGVHQVYGALRGGDR